MDIEKYIESGVLESYVFGLLTESENLEVEQILKQYPEAQLEVEEIEKAVYRLSNSSAPYLSARNYERIKQKLAIKQHVKTLAKPSLGRYIGWAAAILIGIAAFTFYDKYSLAEKQNQIVVTENEQLKDSLVTSNIKIGTVESINSLLRNKDVSKIALGGQTVSPTSYAQVFWNKETNQVIIDASGLPEPPEGMVYQAWSLTLDPLTPTSIGILEDFAATDTKLFTVNHVNHAEAFGITLEPAGGSEFPTLEQLYTLGKV